MEHMNVYFVRHGVTIDNEEHRFSRQDTPLSPKGVQQTEAIGVQCRPIPVDLIITSPAKRAVQTALIINQHAQVPVVEDQAFTELRRPSDIIGREYHNAHDIIEEMRAHATDPVWHHSDEENFHEFRKRMVAALDSVTKRTEENIMIVTHSNAMKMLISVILCGTDVSPDIYYRFRKILTAENTGISFARHNGTLWELVTWNNFTHLESVTEGT